MSVIVSAKKVRVSVGYGRRDARFKEGSDRIRRL